MEFVEFLFDQQQHALAQDEQQPRVLRSGKVSVIGAHTQQSARRGVVSFIGMNLLRENKRMKINFFSEQC